MQLIPYLIYLYPLKRSSLRQALKDAQDLHRKANDDMTKFEMGVF